jgi:hypothetical protein
MGVEGRARRGCREGEKARKSRERAEKEPRKSEREREREREIRGPRGLCLFGSPDFFPRLRSSWQSADHDAGRSFFFFARFNCAFQLTLRSRGAFSIFSHSSNSTDGTSCASHCIGRFAADVIIIAN